jgi:hypothetical protein
MKILFLHGWQSTPGGLKPTYLKDHGHEVLNPALPEDDFDAAVRVAQAEYDQHRPDVVVGSSRGSAVALLTCRRMIATALLALSTPPCTTEPNIIYVNDIGCVIGEHDRP